MNDNSDPSDTPEPAAPDRMRPASRWFVAAPSIALVLGILLGGVLVWLATRDTDPEVENDQSDTSDTSPSPGTAVVVPDACLQAAESVREATELIRGGLDDIRAFRAEEIIDLLNDLEDLDNQARTQARTCSEVEVTDAPLSSPTQAPTTPPEPSTHSPSS